MNFVPWKTKPREGVSVPTSLANLRSEIDRLLENYVREPLSSLEWPFGAQRGCIPPLDLAENPEEVVVRMEVPGLDPNEIEITFSGGQLVLAGEKHDVTQTGGRDFYHTESRFGRFRRAIPMPQVIDPEQIEAEYVNGVLTVRLKKAASTPPKRIAVKVREGEAVQTVPSPAAAGVCDEGE
ncbi:MAG: Hsp20/alpha crystallin family protein [Pirellulales bacterium]|nr:Hsp20/alpha crystallin family protein [Pirellulales bacterium]